MNVLFLAPYPPDTAPSQRYRMEQWQRHLERMGVTITHAAFVSDRLQQVLYRRGFYLTKTAGVLSGLVRRWMDVRNASRYDLVFVHREASIFGPAFFEQLVKRQNVPMIFEMDDALFVPYISPSNRWLSYLKFPGKTGKICGLADHVIVGSGYLATYARKYNSKVTVIPTTVDTDIYRPIGEATHANPVCVGWCGSHSTTRYLRTLVPVFEKLRLRIEYKLLFVGAVRFEINGVMTEFREWVSRNEVADLADMNIGVMPVPEEEWAMGKQGLKALLYMAMEIPVVASPVGANKDIIQDGVNGFLASSSDEWIEKLTCLIEDAALRRRLGAAGRRTVLEKYSTHVHVPRVYEIFEQAIDRRAQ